MIRTSLAIVGMAVGMGCGISEAPSSNQGTRTSGTMATGSTTDSTGTGSSGTNATTSSGSNAATSTSAATTGDTTGTTGSTGAGGSAGTGASGTGGTTGSGGAGPKDGGSLIDGGGSAGGGADGSSTGPLAGRISTSNITIPAAVKKGANNWRIWATASLNVAPVFTAPLTNCGTLVCYTTGTATAPAAQAVRLDANDKWVATIDLGAGLECRGLATEPDGHFAALLWDDANDKIYVKRFDLTGASTFTTELVNRGTDPNYNDPTDFNIGDSRLEFGNGQYGAYYHVHSMSGHEGDTLKYVDATTGAETTKWGWGCSHSMSVVLRYNAMANAFMPACVTDCYPGTSGSDFATSSIGGLYINNSKKVMDLDGDCGGKVAGELGSAAPAASGWKVVFNGHQAAATLGKTSYNTSTMNQDIGFVTIGTNLTPAGAVVWLTNSPAINEADSSIARWQPAGDATEQYVVGWSEPGTAYKFQLARVDAAGAVLEGPVDVSAIAKWGRRDDPFRTHFNGDIVWAWFDASGQTALHFARLRSGGTFACTM
jgi:hypothetical protein